MYCFELARQERIDCSCELTLGGVVGLDTSQSDVVLQFACCTCAKESSPFIASLMSSMKDTVSLSTFLACNGSWLKLGPKGNACQIVS